MTSTTGHTAKATLPRLSEPGSKFATVTVGSEHKQFVVHESLLTHYSKFFRAALTGGFKEARDKTVDLEDQDPGIFEILVHWLYYQRFPARKYNDDKNIIELYLGAIDAQNDQFRLDALIRLYVFGDKYDVERLRLEVVTELFYQILHTPYSDKDFLRAESIDFAFAHLHTDTPLCRLLVDLTWYLDNLDLVEPDKIQSLSFMRSVWKRYKLGNSTGSIKKLDAENVCNYHDHADHVEMEVCRVQSKEMVSLRGRRG